VQGKCTLSGKITSIQRVSPRDGSVEEPDLISKGYCLGDPQFGGEKHHAKNAVYVKTLDEVAEFIARGFSVRMVGPGKRASLVSPKSLQIIRG
jgi:hypothetical protein